MPSFEETIAAHTEALNKNTDALRDFIKHAGGKATTAADDKPARGPGRPRKDDAKEEPRKEEPRKEEPRKDDTKEEEKETVYSVVRDFLNYGDDNNREDEDERDRRGRFVKKMLGFFEVERARDIPEKNLAKVKRWIKLDKAGEKVDFDND